MKIETYFSKIKQFHKDKKRMPSYSEILRATGLRSKNSAYKIIKKLCQREYVKKDKAGKIVPGRLFWETRILGTVEAGFPSPAEEELSDTMSLDEFLIGNREATYLLRADGDSMVDAGIIQGDLVLVERGRQAKDGDIVIAQIDNGWTIKYFRKKGKKIYLEPANKKYQEIYPREELNIVAVVRAVIRKYQ